MSEAVENQEPTEDFEAAFNEIAESSDSPFTDDTPEEEPEVAPETTPEPEEAAPAASPFDTMGEEDLRHRLKSDNGRIGALQRKINSLEQQAKEQPAQMPAIEDTGSQENAEWGTLKEDFPELAQGVESYVQQKLGAVENVSSRVARFEQREQDSQREADFAALSEQYPGWKETSQSDDFGAWVSTQPESVRSLVNSPKLDDALWMLNRFTQDTTPAKGSRADEIKARRNKNLAAAQATPSHRQTPVAIDNTDFDNAFDQFARQHDKVRRR